MGSFAISALSAMTSTRSAIVRLGFQNRRMGGGIAPSRRIVSGFGGARLHSTKSDVLGLSKAEQDMAKKLEQGEDVQREASQLALKAFGLSLLLSCSGFTVLVVGVCNYLGVSSLSEFVQVMRLKIPEKIDRGAGVFGPNVERIGEGYGEALATSGSVRHIRSWARSAREWLGILEDPEDEEAMEANRRAEAIILEALKKGAEGEASSSEVARVSLATAVPDGASAATAPAEGAEGWLVRIRRSLGAKSLQKEGRSDEDRAREVAAKISDVMSDDTKENDGS